MKADIDLDIGRKMFASGLLPEVIAALRRSRPGDLVTLAGEDESIGPELETWCRFTGNPLLEATVENGRARWVSFLKSRPSRFSCAFRTDQAIWPVMVRWLGILLGTLRSTVRAHRELALENLALRQQLAVWTFWGPVRARGAEPRPAPAGAFQCHGTSDRGVDWAATDRGVQARGGPKKSDPGPRPGLWRTIFVSGQDAGHPGSGHCATLDLAKRLCRARDWIDSTGMP